MEIWRDVVGFEGLYKVSNYGNVLSVKSNRLLKPFDNKGYLRVQLWKDGKCFKRLVHRLVAEAFLEKPGDGYQVNHKDLNKKNNHVDNLEWVIPEENVRHAIETIDGRRERLKHDMSAIGKKYGYIGAEKSKKPVVQIDVKTGEIINEFSSAREAAKATGSCYKKISAVCLGLRKTHNGYRWAFK